ncbi:glycosyltransferase [Erwinia sp. CPCC 100877]|nr:glycosyltransferase [Erwinia sp. CPCC 100877]
MSFSILMSLYKKEKPEYLNDCLCSIAKQTLPADDIIVVLDGEVGEELWNVLNNWSERLPLNIHPLEVNVGLGAALNVGLRLCKHDIVARMDTDDVCMPNRFMTQVSFMENNPDIALVGSSIDEYNEDFTHKIRCRKTESEHSKIVRYSKKRNPFNHMTVVFRKEAILNSGGYQHHFYMEDYNLWLRLLAKGYKTYNFRDSLVKVRGGRGMIRRRKGFNYIKSEFLLSRLKRSLKFQNFLEAYIVLCFRVVPRLLPVHALSLLYKKIK